MSYSCPGHSGKCKFCDGEEGHPRFLNGMMLVNNVTGEPNIDFCCKTCENNQRYVEKKFGIYESSKLGSKIPKKGDEIK